jgi:hypothetical protein
MCGIAGAINLRGEPVPDLQRRLDVMGELIAHRGPDGHGTWAHPHGHVGLAHRRLSIFDLSPAGAQPMHGPDGSVTSFNGEIYNWPELRSELAADLVEHAGQQLQRRPQAQVPALAQLVGHQPAGLAAGGQRALVAVDVGRATVGVGGQVDRDQPPVPVDPHRLEHERREHPVQHAGLDEHRRAQLAHQRVDPDAVEAQLPDRREALLGERRLVGHDPLELAGQW